MQPPAPQPRAGGSTAMYVAGGCGLILLLACCLGGAGFATYSLLKSRETPTTGVEGGAGGSVIVSGVVESASGLAAIAPGTPCSFTIEQRTPGQCHASVVCGGTTLYGSSTNNGFFPCTFSTSPASVSGADTSTTSSDGDAMFSIDTASGTFRVADDATGPLGAFTVTARVSSVN